MAKDSITVRLLHFLFFQAESRKIIDIRTMKWIIPFVVRVVATSSLTDVAKLFPIQLFWSVLLHLVSASIFLVVSKLFT